MLSKNASKAWENLSRTLKMGYVLYVENATTINSNLVTIARPWINMLSLMKQVRNIDRYRVTIVRPRNNSMLGLMRQFMRRDSYLKKIGLMVSPTTHHQLSKTSLIYLWKRYKSHTRTWSTNWKTLSRCYADVKRLVWGSTNWMTLSRCEADVKEL